MGITSSYSKYYIPILDNLPLIIPIIIINIITILIIIVLILRVLNIFEIFWVLPIRPCTAYARITYKLSAYIPLRGLCGHS